MEILAIVGAIVIALLGATIVVALLARLLLSPEHPPYLPKNLGGRDSA